MPAHGASPFGEGLAPTALAGHSFTVRPAWVAWVAIAATAVVLLGPCFEALPGPLEPPPDRDRTLAVGSFESDVRVFTTAAVEVREEVTYRFEGAWDGVDREIPLEGERVDGSGWSVQLEELSVQAPDGDELSHQVSRRGDRLRIRTRLPGARDTARTVVYRYRLENALRFRRPDEVGFGDGATDELLLNVTGHATRIRVRSASATLHLPVDATGVRARAWTGGRRHLRPDGAAAEVEGSVVRARTRTSGLAPGEAMKMAVSWDAGVVERPGPLARAGIWVEDNWILLIPLAVLGGLLGLRTVRSRRIELRSVPPRYEPPEGLRPGEVGVLVDLQPDMRDITATLVDLAVRDHLVVEEREVAEPLGRSPETEVVLVRRSERKEWGDLSVHERRVIHGLFGGGFRNEVRLPELENTFYARVPGIQDALFEHLVELGHFSRRPDEVWATWIAAGVAAGMLLYHLGGVAADALLLEGGQVLASSVGTGLVLAAAAWFMPLRTAAGVRALEEVLGFEEFLERVEEDRMHRMIEGPEDFDRYLPYAMALGVERTWAAAFEELYTEPPDWYHGAEPDPAGAGRFRPASFAEALRVLSTRTGAAMASSPRGAAGGSGFTGDDSSTVGF